MSQKYEANARSALNLQEKVVREWNLRRFGVLISMALHLFVRWGDGVSGTSAPPVRLRARGVWLMGVSQARNSHNCQSLGGSDSFGFRVSVPGSGHKSGVQLGWDRITEREHGRMMSLFTLSWDINSGQQNSGKSILQTY